MNLLENIIVEQKKVKEDRILSTFSEIIKDSEREPLKYAENWKAPGGGE